MNKVIDSRELDRAVNLLENSKHTAVFTGAGISVESGIPPFRGEDGLWNEYDPDCFTIEEFRNNPAESWQINKEVFYETFKKTSPNQAHKILAKWEEQGLLEVVITQNIDGLHREAGSRNVVNFHGTSDELKCMKCAQIYPYKNELLEELPPTCVQCNGILKPNFIFFGEGIPQKAYQASLKEAEIADLFLVIGTTGEVMPACMIPRLARREGADIVEINTDKSNFTNTITDIFLQGKATEVLMKLDSKIRSDNSGR